MDKRKIISIICSITFLAELFVPIKVSASNVSQIPTFTAIKQENNRAKLEWATEILDSDVLWRSGFESSDQIPSFGWGWVNYSNGNQSITSEDKYIGYNSFKVFDTIHYGNHYNYPSTSSTRSIMGWGNIKIPNGTPLSLSVKVKTNGTGSIIPYGDGGWGRTLTTISNVWISQNVSSGSYSIRVYGSGLSSIYKGMYITTNTVNDVYPDGKMYQVKEVVDVGNGVKELQLFNPINRDIAQNEPLRTHPWRGAWNFPTRTVTAKDGWVLYNMNTYVSNYSDYDVGVRGGTFYIDTETGDTMYIDEVKMGYATKVQLFRDGTMVYEGYLSDYLDNNAKDNAKPNAVSNITFDYDVNSGNLQANWNASVDNGTTYNYTIKGVSVNGETPLSSNNPITITSGIKGYSVLIDDSPTSIPSGTINTTVNSYNTNIKKENTYYIHIASVDNEGNISNVVHQKVIVPFIQPTANNTGNFVNLKWGVKNDMDKYTYQVWKKEKSQSTFQSIPTKNTVKVLNLYPKMGDMITFTNWKGQTFTLPRSASVKKWMEEPNAENPKGYGMGLIDVDAVCINDFNANPNYYLKNADGTWKYDAIFEGAWDWNGAYDSNNPTGQLNATSLPVVESFIQSGRGYLMGHDTLVANNPIGNQYDYKLRNYFNIGVTSIDYPQYSGSTYGNTKVVIKKKGLLTSYPWNIGDIGSTLTAPYSHVLQQFAKGDVWFTYADEGHQGSILPTSDGSTNNFYLTTWNNTAMIQTGHSNGSATPDEQKILSNTLFYLAQLSDNLEFDDHSSQDITAPNQLALSDIGIKREGLQYTVSLPQTFSDNGTTYQYYLLAKGDKDYKSSTKEATVTTGFKGFSYILDKNPTTEPDNTIDTKTDFTFIADNNTDYYLHVKSIDNAGNISTTSHLKISAINMKAFINTQAQGNYVKLNWGVNANNIFDSTQPYLYKLYKQEESKAYQTVGIQSSNVKVLNIYPYVDSPITFTNWKGQTFTLPKSASLKRWMEEPNAENPKGYGMGIIDVDSVDLSLFNANPDYYLKDSNGNYKYDVIFEGAWDCNGSVDYNATSVESIKQYIQSGRGYLTGHDTLLYPTTWDTYSNQLRGLLNLGLSKVDNFVNVSGSSGSQVNIIKKGLLTGYPWGIGDVGTTLTVPQSHSTGQVAYGDIWMNYTGGALETDIYGKGIANFYLESWNNTAMIQTGHSNGNATPDEQKVIANTLFYLAQLSDSTLTDDHSAQDFKAPDKIDSTKVTLNRNGENTFNIVFNAPKDNGTNYNYYIKATGKKDNNEYTSDIKSTTVTSGIKGYSYIIDKNSFSTVDNTVDTTSTNINANLIYGTYYLHIKAIDNNDNASETIDIPIYVYPTVITPTLTVTPDNVNNRVLLNWSSNDNTQSYKYDLYRDGIKILSDVTYTSYTDILATDKATPNDISNVTINTNTDSGDYVIANVNVTSPTDNGTTYNYYVVAKSTYSGNANTPTKSATVTTGIKSYEYTIGGITSTSSSNTVNINNLLGSVSYTLNVVAIDNGGNRSKVYSKTFITPDLVKITSLTMTGHDNKQKDLVLPINYPVSTPVSVKNMSNIYFNVGVKYMDSLIVELYTNNTLIATKTYAVNRSATTVPISLVLGKDLPLNSVVSIKIRGIQNRADGTKKEIVDTVLGNNAMVIKYNYSNDITVNLTN